MVFLAPPSFQNAIGRVRLHYKIVDTVKKLDDIIVYPGAPYVNDELVLSCTFAPAQPRGHILALLLEPQTDLQLVHFEVSYTMDITDLKMLANGFQSWSQTAELGANDKLAAIPKGVSWVTQHNLQGDYDIFPYSGERGVIHSNSYTHLRDVEHHVRFFGSLTEHLGYTYFKANFNNSTFGIYKDVLGMDLLTNTHTNVPLIRVWMHEMIGARADQDLWDDYTACLWNEKLYSNPDDGVDPQPLYPPAVLERVKAMREPASHVTGWTSWYQYYGDVSEAIVLENLQAYQDHGYPIDIFQIDDGFQTAIGDWLSLNDKFPSGMPFLTKKIHDAGYKAGLWLAPFAVGTNSKIAIVTPEWLVKDDKGQPVLAGPNWGNFYALDIYQEPVRQYIKLVFEVVLQDWQFDMVKLDFLFAAAMIPRLGKSRGQIMDDAMRFLHDECMKKDKLMLGCGVPLAYAWGRADYCRIGSDVAPWWEDPKLKYLNVRERVSTFNSLRSTLGRFAMTGRVFGNDPDVVILRNTPDNKLTEDERHTLCTLNNLLGHLVFSSDNVDVYGEQEHLMYGATFPKVVLSTDAIVRCLEVRSEVYMLEYQLPVASSQHKRRYVTFTNLSDSDQTVYLPSNDASCCLWFGPSFALHCHRQPWLDAPDWYLPSTELFLRAHETRTLMAIPPPAGKDQLVFMGTTSHLVPGSEIQSMQHVPGKGVEVEFKPGHRKCHRLYFGLGLSLMPFHPKKKKKAQEQGAEDEAPLKEIIVNGQRLEFKQVRVQGRSPALIHVAMVDNL
ncbi:glycoside hydrolase [Hesseltinella vesiculosa]|uniref:alpha-galactosidase n=1 Tax=Hesseltinella vesiculosa TaxID=101127 RepID=A0A1X2GWF0_9FUNG|nr:glycoside hydrolase [Hesseltinella vesiculosa]